MDASRANNNNSASPRAAHGDATAPAAAPTIEQGDSSPSPAPIFYRESPSGFSSFQARDRTARVSFGPTDTRPIPPRDRLHGPTAATPPAAAAPAADAADDPQTAFDYDEGDMVHTAEQAERAAAAAAATPPRASTTNTQPATTPVVCETVGEVREHLRAARAPRGVADPTATPPAADTAATEQRTPQVPPLSAQQQQQLAQQQQYASQQQALREQENQILAMQRTLEAQLQALRAQQPQQQQQLQQQLFQQLPAAPPAPAPASPAPSFITLIQQQQQRGDPVLDDPADADAEMEGADDSSVDSDAPMPEHAFAFCEVLSKKVYAYSQPQKKTIKNKKNRTDKHCSNRGRHEQAPEGPPQAQTHCGASGDATNGVTMDHSRKI